MTHRRCAACPGTLPFVSSGGCHQRTANRQGLTVKCRPLTINRRRLKSGCRGSRSSVAEACPCASGVHPDDPGTRHDVSRAHGESGPLGKLLSVGAVCSEQRRALRAHEELQMNSFSGLESFALALPHSPPEGNMQSPRRPISGAEQLRPADRRPWTGQPMAAGGQRTVPLVAN